MHLVYSKPSLWLEISAETHGKKDTLLELNAPAIFLHCRGCLISFNSELCNNLGRQTKVMRDSWKSAGCSLVGAKRKALER